MYSMCKAMLSWHCVSSSLLVRYRSESLDNAVLFKCHLKVTVNAVNLQLMQIRNDSGIWIRTQK